MVKLAVRFGISGVGLKKICAKHKVPVPGRGYWAKVRAGNTQRRTPLPKSKNARTITIYGPQVVRRAAIETDELERWREFETREENQIRGTQRLGNLHPVAETVRSVLSKVRPNHDGLLECLGESPVWVRVSPENVKRAVLIVDALVRAALLRGCELREPQPRNGSWGQHQAALLVEGEPVTFRVSDRLRRVEVIPARNRQRGWKEDLGLLEPRRTRLEPAGGMKLVLCSFGWSEAQRTWVDTGSLVLEYRLNEVMLALREHAERERRQRAERNEWHRRREAAQHRAHEEQLRQELGQKKVRALFEECAAWTRARDLRAYLDELEAEAERTGLLLDSEWLAWAHAQVKRIDPLPSRLARPVDDPNP